MKSDVPAYNSYNELVRDFEIDYPELTKFEALSLALQLQRNQILAAGLVVKQNNSVPNGLEAIGMSLGYDSTIGSHSVADSLLEIRTMMENQQED